jgi:hypothetical protein
MADRQGELRRLVDEVRTFEGVEDAFLAKSFTDRLVIVDVDTDGGVPAEVERLLADHDLYGADRVYEDGDPSDGLADSDRSSTGEVGGATRHHFVDIETRGAHRSYVVE